MRNYMHIILTSSYRHDVNNIKERRNCNSTIVLHRTQQISAAARQDQHADSKDSDQADVNADLSLRWAHR